MRPLLAALLLAGCAKEPLLSQVRQTLADRDARLTSYQFSAQTTQGGNTATHAFFFVSPNKMRASGLAPKMFQWSFDGQRVFTLDQAQKKHTALELKLPPEKAVLYLHSLFSPFVPEGFRAPLMPAKGVSATRQGPEAVALRVEPGEGVTVTWVLRWPSGDFLERRTVTGGVVSALVVEEEQCDAELKLCVPKRLVETVPGRPPLTVVHAGVVLNGELPDEEFAPAVPDGWTSEQRSVVPE